MTSWLSARTPPGQRQGRDLIFDPRMRARFALSPISRGLDLRTRESALIDQMPTQAARDIDLAGDPGVEVAARQFERLKTELQSPGRPGLGAVAAKPVDPALAAVGR